jgi:translation initiation factor 1 (eIF-1/SUI1)
MVQKRLPVSDTMIYSTYPEFEVEYANVHEPETLKPGDQRLTIALNKRKIDGAPVTTITGFRGKRMDLIQLQEALSDVCRTSGSTRMYDIILDRDVRKRAYVYLRNQGFGVQFAAS